MKTCILFISMLFALTITAKNYKGAEIYSTQSYLYGRFEMRIKSAPGSGQLSTFFLYRNSSELNTTLWQEIDIEIFGKDTNSFQSNVIIEKTEGSQLTTEIKHFTKSSLSANYHVYVLEWTPDSINWYVDDSLFRTEKDYAKFCNAAMSIRFNHWASSNSGWVGVFDKDTLPQNQYVDYISYSAYTPGTGDNNTDFTFSWKDDFTSFDSGKWAKANWTFTGNYCDFLPENAYVENDELVLKLHDATPPPVEPTSLHENNTNSEFRIFPNPYTSTISLEIPAESEYCVKVSNVLGEVLFNQSGTTKNNTNAIADFLVNLDKGMYMISIMKDNQAVESKMIIKK